MSSTKQTWDKFMNTAFMQKLKAFMEKHKNIFQIIKFTFMSCIAAIVEVVSLNIMLAALKKYADTEIHWFIFHYGPAEGGLKAFVAFIVSTTLAQIVSYVVNRKKTFNANNNVVFSVTAYIIMEVVIIGLQIWSGPLLTGVLNSAGVPADWDANISKFIWMTLSFVFVFIMDKFVIMRNKDEKKDKVKATETQIVDDETDEFAEEVAAIADDSDRALEEHVAAIEDAVAEGLEAVGMVAPRFEEVAKEALSESIDDYDDKNAVAVAEAVEEGLEQVGMTIPKPSEEE